MVSTSCILKKRNSVTKEFQMEKIKEYSRQSRKRYKEVTNNLCRKEIGEQIEENDKVKAKLESK